MKILSLIIVFLHFFSQSVLAQEIGQTNQNTTFNEIITTIQRKHLNGDDLVSMDSHQLISAYIDKLDPGNLWFTQEDVISLQGSTQIDLKSPRQENLNALRSIYALRLEKQLAEIKYGLAIIKSNSEQLLVAPTGAVLKKRAGSSSELTKGWQENLIRRYQVLLLITPNALAAKEKLKQQYLYRQRLAESRNINDAFEKIVNPLLAILDNQTGYSATKTIIPLQLPYIENIGISIRAGLDYPFIINPNLAGPAKNKLFNNDKIVAISNDDNEYVDLGGMPLEKVVSTIAEGGKSKTFFKILSERSTTIKTVNINPEESTSSIQY